jgi:hypothetical protein
MKRIAWLLIAVFCTAFVRVQPVELSQCSQCVCCHCKVPGACGMPCSRCPAQASAVLSAGQSIKIAQVAVRRSALPARLTGISFYAPCVEPAAFSVALSAPASMATPTAVPLFKAHCSFLI